jgi:tRNA(Ile)-lysidine synthase
VDLGPTLRHFFRHRAPLDAGDGLVVAFSGGPDSTALLWGLARLAPRLGVELTAAHLDHGMDPASAARARRAGELAAELGVALIAQRREVPALRRPGEGQEAAARRLRYAFLAEVRRQTDARYVATAHHRDDQAETVLLRLAYGSGIDGLAAIRPRRGWVVRPLLGLPRHLLAAAVAAAGLAPVADPTNRDLHVPRNRVRRLLLPRLAAGDPGLPGRLADLATAAAGASERLAARLAGHLSPTPVAGGIALRRDRFAALPDPVRPHALALLHRRAGAPYPASAAARRELARQLARAAGVGCDCGGGWRWEGCGPWLLLTRAAPPAAGFSYTLAVPGEVALPQIGARFRLAPGPVEEWMFRSWPLRAGLALPLGPGDEVEIRSRHPEDRIQPFGRSRPRRLDEVLGARRIPRRVRDALPLLVVGGGVAWIPGVAVDERCRLAPGGAAWIAEVVDAAGGNHPPPGAVEESRTCRPGYARYGMRGPRREEGQPS